MFLALVLRSLRGWLQDYVRETWKFKMSGCGVVVVVVVAVGGGGGGGGCLVMFGDV